MANDNITIEHLLLLLYIVVIYFVRRRLHQNTTLKYNAQELNIDIFSFFFLTFYPFILWSVSLLRHMTILQNNAILSEDTFNFGN